MPVRARGDALSYRAEKFVRRNWIVVAAAMVLIATLAGGIVTTSRAEARAKRQFAEVRRLAHSVLFDYHDAIEGLPGSTPVRQRLVKDALGYLDGLRMTRTIPVWSARSLKPTSKSLTYKATHTTRILAIPPALWTVLAKQ